MRPRELRRLKRDGLLVAYRRGIYSRPELVKDAATDAARRKALEVAAEIAGTTAPWIASHETAAIMHGLDLLQDVPKTRITVTGSRRCPGSRPHNRRIQVHLARLAEADLTKVHEVRCTSVARTVVDLARATPFMAAVVAADSALAAAKTSPEELRAVLARCAGQPGIRDARQAIAFADGRAESVLESAARVVMSEHGLPPPDLQVWLDDDAGWIGRVDFCWPQYRTVVEVDGKAKYLNDPSLALRQLKRDARLRKAGYQVVHLTWAEIMYEPDRAIAEIRAAFLPHR